MLPDPIFIDNDAEKKLLLLGCCCSVAVCCILFCQPCCAVLVSGILSQVRVSFHRQPLEGQLNKYTNVMKGWQYRWFLLDPESGFLEYFEVSGWTGFFVKWREDGGGWMKECITCEEWNTFIGLVDICFQFHCLVTLRCFSLHLLDSWWLTSCSKYQCLSPEEVFPDVECFDLPVNGSGSTVLFFNSVRDISSLFRHFLLLLHS